MPFRRLTRLILSTCVLLALTPLVSAAPPPVERQATNVLSAPLDESIAGAPQPEYLVACGDSRSGFTTVSTSYIQVLDCWLTAPTRGNVLVFASTGSGLQNPTDSYRGGVGIRVDGLVETGAERFFDNEPNGGDGTERTVSLSFMKYLTPGPHHFELMVRRVVGNDVSLVNPTLSVLFVPATSPMRMADYYMKDQDFIGSGDYQVHQAVTYNTISAPGPGWIFITSDMNLQYSDGAYLAALNLALDTTEPIVHFYRFVSIDNGALASAYKTVSYTALRPITEAGVHTVTLLAADYLTPTAGTLHLSDATLSAAFIPAASGIVTSTGIYGSSVVDVTSSVTLVDVRSINVTVPSNSWVFIAADAYLGAKGDDVEGKLCLAIDNNPCLAVTNRSVDVVPGKYESFAISYLAELSAGDHIIRLRSSRTSDSVAAVLQVHKASLTAIVPGGRTSLPYVVK